MTGEDGRGAKSVRGGLAGRFAMELHSTRNAAHDDLASFDSAAHNLDIGAS